MHAVSFGRVDAIRHMLERDPNIDINQKNRDGIPLLRQTRRDVATMELLLERGANPNITNKSGATSLHQAAFEGDKEIAQLLIDYKAKVNAQNNEGNTPLHTAVTNGSRRVVKVLLDNRANPFTKNKKGKSALDLAKDEGRLDSDIEIGKLLLTSLFSYYMPRYRMLKEKVGMKLARDIIKKEFDYGTEFLEELDRRLAEEQK